MMKKAIHFLLILIAATGGILFGCVDSEKDLYNPSYKTPNPMGDGFAAPDGFGWSTITTKNVTIEVKDEEGGLYPYIIGIYTEDPLADENASALAVRTANKENNFKVTASVALLPDQKGIYVKQTDCRGRMEVYMFDVPEDNDNFTCRLYYREPATQNRFSTGSAAGKRNSFEKPDYASIPDDAKSSRKYKGVICRKARLTKSLPIITVH